MWLAQKPIEPYVSRCELALLMGVSVATVDRMVAEGMPSVTWGRRTRRFRPSVAIAWEERSGGGRLESVAIAFGSVEGTGL
jgi:phage terminase Nu1 subunit (DNA packaging protein)